MAISGFDRAFAGIVGRLERELNSFDWSWKHLAERAGVSVGTIHKIRMRDYADSPRLRTVWKLCHAVGLELTTVERKRLRRAA